MIPVDEARERILYALAPLPVETLRLEQALGRTLAGDIIARRTQPPLAVSAMDGYAVRSADVAGPGAQLTVAGRVAAGERFTGTLTAGQCVRLFTGAAIPDGADSVVIQEDVETADGSQTILIQTAVQTGAHVRQAGRDFSEGEGLLTAGTRLAPRHIALAAAADWPEVSVYTRPKIGILATGDELIRPGEKGPQTAIVASSLYGLLTAVEEWGGTGIDLGIARDTAASLEAAIEKARGAHMLITLGGASVGDHDLVQDVLKQSGAELDFWRIAMRPGKPLMFSMLDGMPVLGLPGNPVSSMVCARLFLKPALEALQGRVPEKETLVNAVLGVDLPANGQRQDYMRTRLEAGDNGETVATPFPVQDSSMLSTLVLADGLLIRPPHDEERKKGSLVDVLPL